MYSISYYLKNPWSFVFGCMSKISPIIPAKLYLKIWYKSTFWYWPDFNNPKSFDEKIQRLKLNDHNPKYPPLIDKYLVKDIIAKKIWKEYIIPLLWVRDKFDDIDFDKLPKQFVLKCNHDSWSVIIVKDKSKFDKKAAKKKLDKALKFNYYNYAKERAYKFITPKIIAEKYIIDNDTQELRDYKIYAFNGSADYVMTCFDRQMKDTKFFYYDRNWNIKKEFSKDWLNYWDKIKLEKPKFLNKMFEFAETFSKDIPMVRVDFYEANWKLFFGELTFYPGWWFDNTRPKAIEEYLTSKLVIKWWKK